MAAPIRMSRAGRLALLLAIVAGCSPIPTLELIEAGATDSAGPAMMVDATVSGDSGMQVDSGAPNDDGGADDASAMDDSPDDASAADAATIQCGSTLVASCDQCPGATLHCTKGTRNACVSDCNDCAVDWFSCFHCATPDASPKGTCVPVAATGTLVCGVSNLCACTTVADCPSATGSAQVCEMSAKGVGRCLTCGQASTSTLSCQNGSGPTGTTGTCVITDGGAPVCQ